MQRLFIACFMLHRMVCFSEALCGKRARAMGEIVNLKRFRKRAAREEAAKDADAQRARFGRTKAERQQTQDQERKLNTMLDQHRLDEDPA
jgi:hypothetical protein